MSGLYVLRSIRLTSFSLHWFNAPFLFDDSAWATVDRLRPFAARFCAPLCEVYLTFLMLHVPFSNLSALRTFVSAHVPARAQPSIVNTSTMSWAAIGTCLRITVQGSLRIAKVTLER